MRSTEIKTDILIIGYGNPLRGDDGVGWAAAEKLEAEIHERSLDVMTVHQLTPDLASDVADAGLVIFIDASVTDPPGGIACRAITPGDVDARVFTHSMVPDRLVSCACHPFGGSPRAFVYTVGGEFFGYREGLSEVVEAALPELVERVELLIAWWEGRVGQCIET